MKVLVCLDSFKGSLSSLQAGLVVKKAIESCNNSFIVQVCPISDGGEGFLDAINYTLKGKSVAIKVSSPLGDKIDCEYIKLANTAYIEVSKCIGLHLVKNHKNPLYTTTYGLGELILHAINNGCNNFVIGIGGSCTNDGGVGLLQALGYGFLDKNNNPVSLGAIGLKDLVCISDKNANKKLKECTFNIACDVTNPLVGQNGASFVFAKQKGASDLDIVNMDNWLQNYANLTKKLYPTADENALAPNTVLISTRGVIPTNEHKRNAPITPRTIPMMPPVKEIMADSDKN